MKRSHSDTKPSCSNEERSVEMSAKKLINDPNRVVDEAIQGLIATNPNVKAVENHRVVVRSDLQNVSGKVGLVCGGGSGHEPAFTGFVGKGCLSAAVAGSVFASPPPTSILAAILSVAAHNPSGILVVVYNYTGDRVNFGLAVERARSLMDVRCEVFVVADDAALTSADKTAGRRGLAGGKFILKVAGAMAELGRSLDEILNFLNTKLAPNLATIGLSLSPCTVPGRSQPSFNLAVDEMEVGLGVHGEAGVKRMKLAGAKETVRTMLTHLTNPKSSTHLSIRPGDYVAVLLNNLGALSSLEMGILTNEVMMQLQDSHKVVVRRLYPGHFFTSLDMAGFSISIVRLVSPEIAHFLDAETTASGWSGQAFPRRIDGPNASLPDPMKAISKDAAKGPVASKFAKEALLKAITFACEAVMSCEDQLNTLDTGSGDGDCGTTLKRGAHQVLELLKKDPDMASRPSQVFHAIANVAEADMGGSSGAMYSIFFESAASAIESADSVSAEVFGRGFESGLAAIAKYGRAQVGDRTMVDALDPSSKALSGSLRDGKRPLDALEAATCAAENGARATLDMKARAGRASYVPASELKHPDPGAHAIGIIMRAVFEGVKIKANELGFK